MKSYYDDDSAIREDVLSRFIKGVVMVFIGVVIFKWFLSTSLFHHENLSGPGYSMASPIGWERVDKDILKQFQDEDTTIAAYVTPEKNPVTDLPLAQIAVFAVHLPRHMWIDDEIGEIKSSIKSAGHRIIDHGQIEIQEQMFFWAFVDNPQEDTLSLQFFTCSDNKMFYKIVYSSSPKHFRIYRPAFEQVKDTFKIKFGI